MPFSSSAESNAKLLAKAGNDGKRLSRARSSGNLAYIERWGAESYPTSADAYELEHEIGKGASARVWLGECKPLRKKVAIKIMELEHLTCELDVAVREIKVMGGQRHPNVLPMLCSFVYSNQLWMVMPYIDGGSLESLLKKHYPEGMDEIPIATIGLEVLKGLSYLHSRHHIHRDLKSANILVNHHGHVVIGDFGVTATLTEPDEDCAQPMDAGGAGPVPGPPAMPVSSSPSAAAPVVLKSSSSGLHCYLARSTFCGTPCFMAPEVMEQAHGYGTEADMWSFGIMMVELALGRAPYANMSVTSVILTTLRDEPPTLDTIPDADKRWSEDFREVVRLCLCKDPAQRVTAQELMQHRLWKLAESPQYLQHYLLQDKGVSVAIKARLKAVRASLISGLQINTTARDTFTAYASSTLSADVANAMSLLRSLTSGSASRRGRWLSVPRSELHHCHGVAFCILHKNAAGSFNMGKGNGFVIVKRKDVKDEDEAWADGTLKLASLKQPVTAVGKGRDRTQTSVSSFHQTKNGNNGEKVGKWSAPCYVEISVGGLGHSWAHESVEAMLLLSDEAAAEALRHGPTEMDNVMRRADSHVKAYASSKAGSFVLDLVGAVIRVSPEANLRTYGHRVPAELLLDGQVRAPHEFAVLYRMLSSVSASTHAPSSVLSNIENRGSTLLYRMPMWVYES